MLDDSSFERVAGDSKQGRGLDDVAALLQRVFTKCALSLSKSK